MAPNSHYLEIHASLNDKFHVEDLSHNMIHCASCAHTKSRFFALANANSLKSPTYPQQLLLDKCPMTLERSVEDLYATTLLPLYA